MILNVSSNPFKSLLCSNYVTSDCNWCHRPEESVFFASIDLLVDIVATVSWLRVSGNASHYSGLSCLVVLIHTSPSVSRNKWAVGFCVSAIYNLFLNFSS